MEEVVAIDPVRGYKRAWLTWTPDGLRLRGVVKAIYGVEEAASCRRQVALSMLQTTPRVKATRMGATRVVDHDPLDTPSLDCKCGFYAWKDPRHMREHYATSNNSVSLEVDLYGKIIECENGYRAAYQRVLSIEIGPRCMWCTRRPDFMSQIVGDADLRFVCGECIPSRGRVLTPLSHLASQLGTEVRYIPPTPTYEEAVERAAAALRPT